MTKPGTPEAKPADKRAALRAQLQEAQETLRAIRSGEVDALVVTGAHGEQVLRVEGTDLPYRVFLETMNEGALIVGADTTILYCNLRFAELVASARDRLAGSSIGEFVRPMDSGSLADLLEHGRMGTATGDLTLQTTGGTLLPVQLSLRPLKADALHAVCVVVTDLRERKRAEEALRLSMERLEETVRERTRELQQAEAKYRTLIEQVPAVTYLATPEPARPMRYVSPQVERMLGFSPTEWLAGPNQWLAQLHLDDRERVLAQVARCQASNEPFRCEYRLLARDGHVVWILDEAVVVRDDLGDARILQGIMLDLTERKQAEEAAAQATRVRIEELEHELQSMARLSGYPQTAVTAHVLGVQPLSASAPETYRDLVQRYGQLMDLALEQRSYKVDHGLSEGLRSLAEHLGGMNAGPRDVVEIHGETLKGKAGGATPSKAQAYLEEGRLLALELMGDMVSCYRNYLLSGAKTPGTRRRGTRPSSGRPEGEDA